MLKSVSKKRGIQPILVIISIGFFTFTVIRSAWYNDDAFITFRVIDNFVNGYGLTWNISERVEVYSDPLFMLLKSFFYAVTGEIYFTVIFLSISISIISLWILYFKISRSLLFGLLAIIILSFSKGFVDYSTSGMENPMTHLLLAIFFFIYFRERKNVNLQTIFLLSLVASFGIFNRMDTIVLFLPSLIYVFFQAPQVKKAGIMIIGFMPFLIWKSFSFFYYGFLFPNSAYSKALTTDVDKSILIQKGIFYLENSLHWDPILLSTIFGTVAITIFYNKKRDNMPIIVGIVLYLLLVILIGGDNMGLRFLTAPLFLSAILITRFEINKNQFKFIVPLFFAVIILGSILPYSPIWKGTDYGNYGYNAERDINDVLSVFYPYTGLLRSENPQIINHEWIELTKNENIIILTGVGVAGFFGGPELYIIDPLGAGDPFISHLPAPKNYDWRVGHYLRFFPPGYIDSKISGENKIVDKDLAVYYDKISIITKGELFDNKRIETIFKMNFGEYDNHLESYLSRPIQTNLSNFEPEKVKTTPHFWGKWSKNIVITENGVLINLEQKYNQETINFSISANGEYEIIYFNENNIVAIQNFNTGDATDITQIVDYTVKIPFSAVEQGYDKIKLNSLKHDNLYMLRDLTI